MKEKLNPINKRIKELIDEQELTYTSFCDSIGISESTLKTTFNRDTNPGIEMIIGIANEYPQYSLDWLLVGRGDKLKQSYILRISTDPEETGMNESLLSYGSPVLNKEEYIKRLEKELSYMIDSCHTLVKTNSQLVDLNAKLQLNGEKRQD